MSFINKPPQQGESLNKTVTSLDSVPEIKAKDELIYRTILISVNLLSLLIGLKMLIDSSFYFNSNNKYPHLTSLYIFVIIYTFGMIFSLVISFIIALIVKIIKDKKNKNQSIPENSLVVNEDNHSVLSLFVINKKSNQFNLMSYVFSFFIAITVGIYFISGPYALCLFFSLLINSPYSNIISYFLLYLFVLINMAAGALMIYILYIMITAKRKGSVRKENYDINNGDIENIREEIRNAMKTTEA